MARRRDSVLQFDLVPEDTEAAPHPPEAEPEPSRFSRLLARLRRRWAAVPRRRRALVGGATAAALAVVVVGGVLVDAERDRRHAEVMRALPGGVADLSVPPDVAWELDVDQGVIAVLPGGVVVTRDLADVLGVDVTTGEVLWRHALGAGPDCGPTSWNVAELARAVEQVVCVSGRPAARTVTVIDAAGTVVGERELGEANTYAAGEWIGGAPLVIPAADGAVAVLEAEDLTVAAPSGDDLLERLDGLRESGRWSDPVLRLEDALTGEVRAEATVRIQDEQQVQACWVGPDEEEDGAEEGTLWLSSTLGASPSATWAMFCNAGVAMLADGTVVDDGAGGYAWPSGTADGRVLLGVEDGTLILDAHGRELGSVPGYVVEPTAVDGDGDVTLAADEDMRVAGFGPDGERRWSGDVHSYRFLARTAGTAVLVTVDDDLVGLDLGTGEVRWTRDDLGGETRAYESSGLPTQTVTDGRRVLLEVWSSSVNHLVALDARSGRTVWDREREDLLGTLLAVDGHLLAYEEGQSFRQEEVDGLLLETSDATLRGLTTG